jgi:hypothetical protein
MGSAKSRIRHHKNLLGDRQLVFPFGVSSMDEDTQGLGNAIGEHVQPIGLVRSSVQPAPLFLPLPTDVWTGSLK